MARPKTDFRNEVKTRVRDATYDALQQYMRDNRSASEARAISDLLELALFGVVGTVPPVVAAAVRLPNMGFCGPITQAGGEHGD